MDPLPPGPELRDGSGFEPYGNDDFDPKFNFNPVDMSDSASVTFTQKMADVLNTARDYLHAYEPGGQFGSVLRRLDCGVRGPRVVAGQKWTKQQLVQLHARTNDGGLKERFDFIRDHVNTQPEGRDFLQSWSAFLRLLEASCRAQRTQSLSLRQGHWMLY